MSHIDDLQGLFHADLAVEVLVVHQKLDQVKEVSRLKAGLIGDAHLIHGQELIPSCIEAG